MATDEEIEALFVKKPRKPRPPKFNEDTPLGKLRKVLNVSMTGLGRIIGKGSCLIYAVETRRCQSFKYEHILKIYAYAKQHGIELDRSLIEEVDMAYKSKGIPVRSVDNFDREPITPIQALRYRMQVKFMDWIKMIDLSYNQAVMYERGGSIVPIDLGKRMQEEARKLGVAVTLDELYQNVVPRGMEVESFEQE